MLRIASPTDPGVFGPEILVDVSTGESWVRSEGQMPPRGTRVTNAFLVSVGRTVLVISSGVPTESRRRVAHRMRHESAESIPVLFSEVAAEPDDFRATSDCVDDCPNATLASALVYALVQRSLYEFSQFRVVVDGVVSYVDVVLRRGPPLVQLADVRRPS